VIVWIVIILTIGVNALYVAAEFGAVSVRTSKIQQQAEQGGALAKRLLPFLRDPQALDRYIAACQIGITLSSLILGAYGQATLARQLAPHLERMGRMQEVAAASSSAVVVLLLLTIFQMVLGELIPKSVALQFPSRAATLTVIPMQWSLHLFYWFIKVLNGSGAFLLRLIGFEASGHRHIHSAEELEYLITESRKGGVLDPAEHRRLGRALRLGVVRADEILVPRVHVEAIDVETPPDEALATIIASPYTRLPVYQDTIDDVIGVVHTKDVARLAASGSGSIDLRAALRPALIIPGSLTADQLLVRMREERRQFAVVLDEYGGTAGIVTIEDVLELVIGDVADEFKPADPRAERLPDGRVRLPGLLPLLEMESLVGVRWEEQEAHTVGGRVIEELGRLPVLGERLAIEGVEVEVERVGRTAVRSILVTPVDRRDASRPDEGAS
jgi:putative hemolysin